MYRLLHDLLCHQLPGFSLTTPGDSAVTLLFSPSPCT
jgi:hypothetical protein